ncbi:MAG: hypothetical protein ACOYNO_11885 [Saprospiraceae bacterium]|jgi:hypothetical protein
MATRKKFAAKQKYAEQDAKDGRMFMIILGVVTLILVALLYFLYV